MRRFVCIRLMFAAMTMIVITAAQARSFRRSFRNGYPAEWNISREQAEDTFVIKGSKMTYSNGRGLTIVTDGNVVSQRNVRVVRPNRRALRPVTDGRKTKRDIEKSVSPGTKNHMRIPTRTR